MARWIVPIEWCGIDKCEAWLCSIAAALENGHADLGDGEVELQTRNDGVYFGELRIVEIARLYGEEGVLLTLRPTASVSLFTGWLLTKLPSTARVRWIDGWPHLYCPPNDDREAEDDPAPIAPDLLVQA